MPLTTPPRRHTAGVRMCRAVAAVLLWYYHAVEKVIPRGLMRTVSVKIPEDLDRALDQEAERLGVGRSEVLRRALRYFLREGNGSFVDLARDVIGSLDGPPDLSTNPKYMEGFGE